MGWEQPNSLDVCAGARAFNDDKQLLELELGFRRKSLSGSHRLPKGRNV